jgi:alkanesulfonate monooxygenase SsuD/methylene tetrahydromethanopterin reductase-like flavin-dependent oxidoreductase (luciferase family)
MNGQSSNVGTSVGITLPIAFGIRPHDLIEIAVRAEEAGLHAIDCPEFASTEAFSLLGAIAQATSRVRLEAAVVAASSRSPALLAMAASTLASISGDRFTLGIGAGSQIVSSYHRAATDRPFSLLASTLRDVRTLLAGDALHDTGGFRIRGIEAQPVRIVLAAMNQRMYRLAAREADGVIINFIGPAQIAELAPQLREVRAASGNTRPFEIIVNLHAASDDRGSPTDVYRHEMAPYLAVDTYRNNAIRLSSVAEVDAAAKAWRNGGRAAAATAFPQSIVDAGIVVGRDAIRRHLDDLFAAGCDGVRLTPVSVAGSDPRPVLDLVSTIAAVLAEASHWSGEAILDP